MGKTVILLWEGGPIALIKPTTDYPKASCIFKFICWEIAVHLSFTVDCKNSGAMQRLMPKAYFALLLFVMKSSHL